MTTKTIFAGSALLFALALPSANAQTPPDPATPPPAAATPATPPPDTTPAPPAAPAPEPPKPSKRFRIGPEIGVFLPTSSKTRDQFGSSWFSVGIGLGTIDKITAQGHVAFDLQVLYQKKGDNHAFVAPVGVSYRRAVGQSGGNTAYVGATGDLYLADLRSGDYNVHSGLRTGVGGSVLAGVNFGDSGFLEARYLLVSRIKGFDLSGLNLTAGYRF